VPIANENRLVVADTLGTTIKSTSMASLEMPACIAPAGHGSSRRCHLSIGPTIVTCLEIRWPPGFWFNGPAPSRYSQPRAGRSATECERGRGLSALAGAPIADSLLMTQRVSGSPSAPRSAIRVCSWEFTQHHVRAATSRERVGVPCGARMRSVDSQGERQWARVEARAGSVVKPVAAAGCGLRPALPF